MTSGLPRQVLRPSLLERLTGEPTVDRPVEDLQIGMRELRREVLRDLRYLLNTRALLAGETAEYTEVQRSLLAYGIPDISSMSMSSEDDIGRLQRMLTDVIRNFEPRIDPKSVRVEALEVDTKAVTPVANLQFRVHATLHVEPFRELVTFDTHIEVETGTVRVEDSAA